MKETPDVTDDYLTSCWMTVDMETHALERKTEAETQRLLHATWLQQPEV